MMTKIKTILLTATFAALGGACATHYLLPTTIATVNPAISSVSASSYDHTAQQAIAELKQTIEQLQHENARLKNILATYPHNPAASKNQSSQVSSTPNDQQVQLQTQLRQLEMEKQLRNANDFTNKLVQAQQKNPNFNLNHTLAQRFNSESRDPQWAVEQENSYRNLFNETTELAGFALRDSQCKSSQCELTVSITNLEQADQLLQKMNSALAANNKSAVIVIAPDAQAGSSKLYISEDATSFEFN